MADKKKNTSRPTSQATRATLKPSEKDQPVKSISAMARDEARNSKEQTELGSKPAVKSISDMARDERKSSKEQVKLDSKPAVKSTSTALRNEQKKERPVQARRELKEPSWLTRFRNSRIGRFVFDSYYELRHKVTWPTFEEARNMTIIVIVLSSIIGLALFAVDSGLYYLFLLISGGK
jgi:preprotein translocase SecE subunit